MVESDSKSMRNSATVLLVVAVGILGLFAHSQTVALRQQRQQVRELTEKLDSAQKTSSLELQGKTAEQARDEAGCSSNQVLPPYVITKHRIAPQTDDAQRDEFTIIHGNAVLTVWYYGSQTNSSPDDGSFSMDQILKNPKVLQSHRYWPDADLSQVPEVGTTIRQCITHKDKFHGDDRVIATQPTSEPCMIRIGNKLQYEPSPNAGRFTYVMFDIVSERLQ